MSTIAASARIHPMAVVEDGAVIGENVTVGPFCQVGPKVVLGDNVELVSHAVVTGRTQIGRGSRIFPMAVIGGDPQSVHHAGEETTLFVGENCTMREGVTMNTGTVDGVAPPLSATTACFSPIPTWRMIASSATTSSCRTMSCWPAM
jgi:UDP-N-acetylglucosamine acyltransferase